MRVKIDVDGIDDVIEKLGRNAASELEDAIELDLRTEANAMALQAGKDAPVDTGALRASIMYSTRRGGKLTYYWGSRLPYALRQEYEHKTKNGWMRKAWRVGKRKTGATISLTIRRKLK